MHLYFVYKYMIHIMYTRIISSTQGPESRLVEFCMITKVVRFWVEVNDGTIVDLRLKEVDTESLISSSKNILLSSLCFVTIGAVKDVERQEIG